MPTKHKIVNGPPFKQFLFRGHAVDGNNATIQFTLDPPLAKNDDRDDTVYIVMVGKPPPALTGILKDDEYRFIARSYNGSYKRKLGPFWLIGTYDAQTRKGECIKCEGGHFFAGLVTRELFPDEWFTWLKTQTTKA